MNYLIFATIVCISIWGYKRIDWFRYFRDTEFQYYLSDSCRFIETLTILTEIILSLTGIGLFIYFGGQLVNLFIK